MEIAVSNIAWDESEDTQVAEMLQGMGVKHLEIAPTKIWPEPLEVSDEDIANVQSFWSQYGIDIVAFQSMMFKRPDLQIFGSNSQEGLDYLNKFIDLAGRMGASAMVFGSPKNRLKGDIETSKALDLAERFFHKLGNTAATNHVFFCIEPNPTAYNCDFITTAQQGIDLVQKIDNPGFGLHLDMGGMTLAGDDSAASIKKAAKVLRHFHVSAPFLGQVEDKADIDYRAASQALKQIGYDKYISIEMRPGEIGENAERVRKAVKFTQEVFGYDS
jgi:D-psicose/D-tagatose/L-ribulose 3-epimerase